MRVVCGDPDCRTEFPVSTEDPIWECGSCGREIVNRKYPFLTAKLMQANIDGDNADWKARFGELVEQARLEIVKRSEEKEMVVDMLEQADLKIVKKSGGKKIVIDLSFLNDADALLTSEDDRENGEWRIFHDNLLVKAREAVLKLDELNQ